MMTVDQSVMMEAMDVEAVRALLAPLWAKNRSHILERLAHVRGALSSDAAPTDDDRTDLHALVGTLGTYGWPDGSALVERVRLHLIDRVERPPTPHDDAVRDELLRELDDLTATLSNA